PSRCSIQFIHPLCRLHMQHTQHVRKVRRIRGALRRMRYKMVMVREDRPSLQSPAEIARHRQQPTLQNPQTMRPSEMMSLQISARRQEISPPNAELMRRRMRPRHAANLHGAILTKPAAAAKPKKTIL